MGILGGMNLGHGSPVKVIRTNFLCTTISGACTSQALSNFLTLVNNRLPQILQCDYITTVLNSVGGFNYLFPVVIERSLQEHGVVAMGFQSGAVGQLTRMHMKITWHSWDQVHSRLAVKSTAPSHTNSHTDVQAKSNGHIIALTGLSAIKMTINAAGDNFDNESGVDLPGGTLDESQLDFNAILANQLTTGADVADLSRPLSSIRSGGGVSNIDHTIAGLNDGFNVLREIEGLTPTTFTSLELT